MNEHDSNKTAKLRGALHVHTKLSHDGTLSLDELVKFLKARGYDYVALTEHSYDINQESINRLTEECEKISTPEFLVISGIEFRCHDNIDIIGYGVTITCDSDDPATVISHIQAHGGVAVFAHPTARNYPIEEEWVRLLDGAEIWNRHEGKYFPRVVSMEKFRLFQRWHPKLLAFCGLDFHKKANFYNITTIVEADCNERITILQSMRNGRFYADSPYFNIKSTGHMNNLKRIIVYSFSAILNVVRNTREVFES